MPVNPGARFQVDPVPIKAPGTCFVCKGTVGPVIRTGLRHDYYKEKPDASRDGNVYICRACIVDMFNTFEQADPLIDTKLRRVYEAGILVGKTEAITHWKKKLDELLSGVDGVDFSAYSDVISHDYISSFNSTEAAESEQPVPDETTKNGEQTGKPVSGEGPAGLSSGNSDGLDDIFA